MSLKLDTFVNKEMLRKDSSPVKICKKCGRYFEYRSKWRNSWEETQFCSKKCSSNFSAVKFQLLYDLAKSKLNTFTKKQSFSALDLAIKINSENKEVLKQNILEILRFMYQEKAIKLVLSRADSKKNSFSLRTKFKRS